MSKIYAIFKGTINIYLIECMIMLNDQFSVCVYALSTMIMSACYFKMDTQNKYTIT